MRPDWTKLHVASQAQKTCTLYVFSSLVYSLLLIDFNNILDVNSIHIINHNIVNLEVNSECISHYFIYLEVNSIHIISTYRVYLEVNSKHAIEYHIELNLNV